MTTTTTSASIADLAVELGVSVAALYHAGTRGELRLFRVHGRWYCDIAEAKAWAAR